MRSLKFLIVNFFVLVGIFATVQISNAQHSKTINIDERLFSRYDADYLNDMQINNPQELDYLNFILDNGYKISGLPGDKLGGIQQLYKLHPITGKAIKQALKNFDYENINIFEYDFEFPKSGIKYYRIGTDYKLITFFSEKKLRKDYEKSKSVVDLQKSNMSVTDDDDLSFYMEIVGTNPEPLSEEDGDTLKICPSNESTAGITEVMFNAAGTYFDGSTLDIETTTFTWIFGDGSPVNNGETDPIGLSLINHTYQNPGIYKVKVKAIDVNNINSTDTTIATRIIKVSTIPNFAGTNISELAVCSATSIDLDGDVAFPEYAMSIDTLGGAGITFLPDGSGVSYTTVITHNAFEDGQTLGSITDLEAICINMEHSYSGDFTIELTCPSGQTIELKHNDGGGTFLGEPLDGAPGDNPPTDDPSVNPPGIGYEYCWNHNPEFGTMTEVASGVSTLPAGSYQPTEPTGFAPLAGCELNGDWVITVTDLLSIDNGWIFYWSLFFNEDIIPTTGGDFLPTVEDTAQVWSWGDVTGVLPNINTGYTNGDQTTAMPTLDGIEARTIPYVYTVTNDFGCSFDTTIYVFVMEDAGGPCCEKPSVIISGADKVQEICGLTYQLDVTTHITGSNIGFWSYNNEIISLTNDSVESPFVTTEVPGEHQFVWTEGALNSNGQMVQTCMDSDTLFVNFNLLPDANTESDTIYFCPQIDEDGNIIGELDGILTPGEQYECYWHGTGFNETNFLGEEDSIPNATFLAPAYGSYDLIFTESNGICSNLKKVNAVFIRPPNAMAGSEENATDMVCQTDGSSDYELMASPLNSGETGTWTSPEGTTFNDPGGINNAISNITAPSEIGTYEFTWTITKEHCLPDFDAINITFVEDADAVANADAGGQSGSNVEVCGNVYVFNAIPPANTGTGTWVTSELDNVAYSNPNSYESDVTIPNGAISAIEGFNEIKFLWIVNNDYCTAKDSINVKFYKEPISNAHIPFGYVSTDIQDNGYYDVCGKTVQLNAQTSLTNFVGQWSSDIPANVSYDDPSTDEIETNANYIPNPIVSVTTNGQYTFTWTEKNEFYQTCESSSDLLIDFKELPVPDADNSTNGTTENKFAVCGLETPLNAVNVPNSDFERTWITPPNTSIEEPTEEGAIAISQEYGEKAFIWTVSNGVCVVKDTVFVDFLVIPEPEFHTLDSLSNCDLSFSSLNAKAESVENLPSEATWEWIAVETGVTFTNANTVQTDVEVSEEGIYVFTFKVENPSIYPNDPTTCIVEPTRTVEFISLPIPVIENENFVACGDTFLLQATEPNVNENITIQNWQVSSSNIEILEENNSVTNAVLIATYNTYTFEWWLKKQGTLQEDVFCNVKEEIEVNFVEEPRSDFEIIHPVCENGVATLNAGEANLNYEWTYDNDNGVLVSEEDTLQEIKLKWNTDVAEDSTHIVTLSVTDDFGCSTDSTNIIREPKGITLTFTMEDETCEKGNGELSVTPYINEIDTVFTYLWTMENDVNDFSYLEDSIYNLGDTLVAGWYKIKVNYRNNCFKIDSIEIKNLGALEADITNSGELKGFVPHEVTFNDASSFDDGEGAGASYIWRFYLTEKAPESSKINFDSEDPATVKFEDKETDEIKGKDEEHKNPVVKFIEPGFYRTHLKVTSKEKCVSKITFPEIIEIEANLEVKMPNIFSPNSAIPENRFFKPDFGEKIEAVSTFDCKVFNRWGKEIYSWTNENEGWDGKINGNVAATGTYYYVAEIKDLTGNITKSKNSFYLVGE